MLWMLDPSGKIVYCSPSVYTLRGYTAEEVVGQSLRDVLTDECYALAAARLQSLRQGTPMPGDLRMEMELRCKNASTVWAEIRAEPLFEDGKLVGVSGVTRDISADREAGRQLREANRELERAMRAKDDFFARMSHDIRTPLNGILGMIELLFDTGPSEVQQRHLEAARSAGWALTALIDNLLAFSDAGAARGKPEPRNLAVPTKCPPLALLVAEDVEQNVEVIRAVLEREDHRVTVVGNGHEAVAAAREGGFDVILMDVFMPEMDGIEATRQIRSFQGKAGDVPIMALTANVLPQAHEQYLAAGMDLVLLKPIEIEPLRRALIAVADGNARAVAAPVPPAALAADAVLDQAWLDEMLQALPPEQVRKLIGNAGLAIAEHLGEIEGRVATADMASLAGAAHRLAGLAAMYGCVRLRGIAVAVEDAARAGRSDGVGAALDRLSDAVEAALAALDGVVTTQLAKQ